MFDFLLDFVLSSLSMVQRWTEARATWLVFVVLLAVTGGAGYGLSRLLARLRRRWLRILLSIVGAGVAFVATVVVLTVHGLSTEPVDAAAFAGLTSFDIDVNDGAGNVRRITLRVPEATPVDTDVEITLLMPAAAGSATTATRSALMRVGGDVKVRNRIPTTTCAPEVAASQPAQQPNESRVLACGVDAEPASVVYRWIARADKPGDSLASFTFPAGWEQMIALPGWTAQPSTNGVVWTYWMTPNGKPWIPGRDRSGMTRQPLVLSAANRSVEADDRSHFEASFYEGAMRAPLKFKTTLGVTRETYAYIGAAGAVLSALLGGGWVWQLVSWVKGRKAKTAPHVPIGRRRDPPGR